MGSHINHRFNGENHSRYHEHTCSGFLDISHPGVLMKLQSYPVSADFSYHGIAVRVRMLIHRLTHISQISPGLYFFQTFLHTFLCHLHQLFLLAADFSDTEHTGGIRKIAV